MDMTLMKPVRVAPFAASAPHGDYRVLVATLQAMQLSTATAQAGSRVTPRPIVPERAMPLIDILNADAGWEEAVVSQAGSFNPRLVQLRATG